ncbi:hypothetical protein KQX54_009169 [Cotesia glomerata]|uniref:Uncharacterized protein n=1 Tax=Cotesia glomerata TaxID=32391 RepID=A0AAV7I3T6_COTGL|nr:hypothetical protein KQX54_009169 [Cotesia glomerata]
MTYQNENALQRPNETLAVDDILIKKLSSNAAYAVDKPAILNALKSVLRGARDWDGHANLLYVEILLGYLRVSTGLTQLEPYRVYPIGI